MRLLTILLILGAATAAVASSRFEVVGLSATHLAVRELFTRSQCCGAPEVVDCRYDGVARLERALDDIAAPPRTVVPRRYGAVRLHVLPYARGDVVTLTADTPGLTTFTIYDSVTTVSACTDRARAEAALVAARAHARAVGIDLAAPLTMLTLAEPTLPVERCLPERFGDACRPDEAEAPEYLVMARRPDVVVLDLFVKVAPHLWASTTITHNGAMWLAPRRAGSNHHGRVVHFRPFTSAMNEVEERPLFFVEPPVP